MNPRELPIYELRDELTEALRTENRLLIEAPTGSGKSTQIPQIVLDGGTAGPGEVVVLQPRRLAARLLARRVAFERSVELGGEVGYQVRMERHVSDKTMIRYVTEGILLRQFLSDPKLKGVSTIIFDEFHERHIYGDITLARALLLQQTRPDLKVIVMSATLDAGPLRDYLAPCRELKSEGRMYPVEIEYSPKRIDFKHHPVWEAAADAFETAIEGGAEGDVLVFMPGAYEIARTVEAIRGRKCAREFAVLPLHGELRANEQDAAVGDCGQRKCVVATNVAETSITIDGIRVVIDSGLARIARYDPRRGIDTLLVERISQASAAQRAGRGGRTAPGVCMRLWTEKEHAARPAQELPEILRHDLAEVVLTLKAGGITDIENFQWLEKPDPLSLERTLTLLTDLGALDHDGNLTEVGQKMVRFPMHPRYARMLLAGQDYECVRQACLIAALTQGRGILERNKGKQTRGQRDDLLGEDDVSDFKRLMRAWVFADKNGFRADACRKLGIHGGAARQVKPLYERFLKIAKSEGLTINTRPPEDEDLQKCILTAFSDQVAKRRDQGTLHCEVVHGRSGDLDRDSMVRDAELFVAAEIAEIEGSRELNVRLNLCTAIEEEWLEELFPDDMDAHKKTIFNPMLKRVVTKRWTEFRGLELDAIFSQEVDEQEAAEIIAAEVIAGRLDIPKWDEQIERWITRVNCLAQNCPDYGIPEIDDEARETMVQEICLGAVCRKDLKERPVKKVVKSWLTPAQRDMIDKQAPEKITLPSGFGCRVRYEPNQPPIISATIQKLYGLEESPRIGFGQIPVVVEALAPNRRPQQKTTDMKSFWANSYPMLKKELKGRYPKHEWK
ncbi:ATP-dependent helicase HrpB [Tichowtungia aerotolerans]|uniref:ATP-dependent helicase HrpB n=1 Tax=Tichowtungia aerotolerans TaxID=2697043 RepID=A0A6P1M1R4_9BACT|nr:ATP-dependent helicase HrpB [Tichowtungia aerotolerans]QHI68759.1 ATP-dependent helicase HrpB [Tichowtungia aerotolerans]